MNLNLGVNTLQKHGLNNHKEVSDLTEALDHVKRPVCLSNVYCHDYNFGRKCSSNVHGSQQLLDGNIDKQKVVILTFDDGYKNQYSNAKPIFDKMDSRPHSISCTTM